MTLRTPVLVVVVDVAFVVVGERVRHGWVRLLEVGGEKWGWWMRKEGERGGCPNVQIWRAGLVKEPTSPGPRGSTLPYSSVIANSPKAKKMLSCDERRLLYFVCVVNAPFPLEPQSKVGFAIVVARYRVGP